VALPHPPLMSYIANSQGKNQYGIVGKSAECK
jgi:hypothetical protein